MPLDALRDLAVIFALSAGLILVLGRLRIPSVVGLLLAGTMVGPSGLGLVSDPRRVEELAEIGVVALLFTIGMEFSRDRLARIGRYVAFGGGLQVVLTVGAVLGLALAAGRTVAEGLFWGYLAALSSTAIVLRLLAERQELEAPHGRLTVGALLFQDLCMVPMMLSLPLLAGDGDATGLAFVVAKAAVLVAGVLVLARHGIPHVLRRIVALRQREVFLLSILAIGLAVAAGTSALGLSLALGGFCAGVTLAESEWVHQAMSEVTPMRDVFASLFFVSVGMLLSPADIVASPARVLLLFLALLVGKAALATFAGLLLRFPARVAAQTGFALAQVGEFSFVLLRAGQDLGLARADDARDFLTASVLTMIVAPLFVAASPRLAAGARLLRPLERLFAVRTPASEERRDARTLRDHVVVAGVGVAGHALVTAMERAQMPYVALDVNPELVLHERRAGRRVRFGDSSSPEVLEHAARAGEARMLVIVVSDTDAVLRTTSIARSRWPGLSVLARVRRPGPVEEELRRLGAEVVVEETETALVVVERVLRRRTDVIGEGIRRGMEAEHPEDVDPATLLEDVALEPLVLSPGDRLAGTSIGDSRMRSHTRATIVAVSRAATVTLHPPAQMVLQPGDILLLFGTHAQVAQARAWIRHEVGA